MAQERAGEQAKDLQATSPVENRTATQAHSIRLQHPALFLYDCLPEPPFVEQLTPTGDSIEEQLVHVGRPHI